MDDVFPSQAPTEADPAAPRTGLLYARRERVGDYRILREIGRGGMGAVYEAEQISLGRHVALKVLPFESLNNPTFLERFQREARAAARLHHTNIVPVFGVGEEEGIHFYAMQFIQGESLDRVLRTLRQLRERQVVGTAAVSPTATAPGEVLPGLLTGRFAPPASPGSAPTLPLPPSSGSGTAISGGGSLEWHYCRNVARVGLQIAEGLSYAHKQGIIHRDIKPSNLLLDGHGIAWITDFGLAKAEGADELTQSGDIVGTVRYMAPERFSGHTLPQSDIYSLGLTLYELLTLQPAFEDSDRARLIGRVLHESPRPPRQIDPHIPRDLETIVLKAVAKEPGARFASAEALAEDLRRFLADRPIHARRTPWHERTWRWCRRNPMIAGLLAIVAVTLIAGCAVATALAVVAEQNADRADREAESARQAQRQSDMDAADARLARDRAQKADALRKVQLERAEWLAYASNISQAQQAWKYGDGKQAWRFLDSTQPELRGWEYAYLATLFNKNQLTLHGNKDVVWSVAYSPDGKRLAAGSGGPTTGQSKPGEIKVWDLATRTEILTLKGHPGSVFALAFSRDGKRLASADAAGMLKIWDAVSGQEIHSVQAHHGPIRSVAYSPVSELVVTACDDRTFKFWDAQSGKLLKAVGAHNGEVRSVAFSPDGKRIATASRDRTVKIWKVETGQHLLTFNKHSEPADCVVFSPDGLHVASAGQLTIKVWDAETGKVQNAYYGYTGGFSALAWHPSGTKLLSSNWNSVIKVWDLIRDREAYFLQGHKEDVPCVTFSPDGSQIASASQDGTVKLWKVDGEPEAVWGHSLHETADLVIRQGPPDSLTLRAHTWWVKSVALSPDALLLASGGQDKTVKVWDLTTRQVLHSYAGHQSPVRTVAFSPVDKRLASAGLNGTVRLWDGASGKELLIFQDPSGSILTLAFSPDGRQLAAAGSKGEIVLWDTETGQTAFSVAARQGAIQSVAIAPGGKRLASAGTDGTIKVWDLATGKMLLSLEGHKDRVRSVAFSRDGTRIGSGGQDQTVRVWNAATGGLLLTLHGHNHYVSSVTFSPDGKRIASASEDTTVKLWDAEKGQEVLTLSGHAFGVNSVVFSADGNRLVSGSDDWTVKVWDAGGAVP